MHNTYSLGEPQRKRQKYQIKPVQRRNIRGNQPLQTNGSSLISWSQRLCSVPPVPEPLLKLENEHGTRYQAKESSVGNIGDDQDYKSVDTVAVPPLPPPPPLWTIDGEDEKETPREQRATLPPPPLLEEMERELTNKRRRQKFHCVVKGCDFTSIHPASYRRHVKAHDRSRDERHYCVWPGCDKSYSRQDHLRRHERIHRNEWNFQCDICDIKFTRRDKLNAHRARHLTT